MKHTLILFTSLLLVPLGILQATDINVFRQPIPAADLPDLALQPAQVITEFGPDHVMDSTVAGLLFSVGGVCHGEVGV